MTRWQRLWAFAFTLVFAIVLALDSGAVYLFESSPAIPYHHPFHAEAAICSPRTGYSFCAVLTQVHTQIGSSDSSNFPVGVIGTANGSGAGAFTSSNVDLRTVGNGGKIQHTVSGFLISGFYSSGGSITGTVGQTCNLSSFNNSLSGASATITLTGTNTIAANTRFTAITAGGSGASTGPTSATFTSGTATCSGTPSISGTVQTVAVPADLVVTSDSSGTTLLHWEIASYTASTGAIEFYQNESISHTTDTLSYISFGNASQTAWIGNVAGTWNSGFVVVLHTENVVLTSSKITTSIDSTAQDNTVSGVSSDLTSVTGIAGAGQSGSGTSNSELGGTPVGFPVGSSVRTLESWWNRSSTAVTGVQITSGWGNKTNDQAWMVGACDAATCGNLYYGSAVYFGANCRFTAPTLDSNWHHSAITLPSGTTESATLIYFDGASQSPTCTNGGNTINTVLNATGAFCIGGQVACDGNNTWNGKIDEVRVSNVPRSADWILATYNNLHAPGSFVTASNTVTAGGNMPPAIF